MFMTVGLNFYTIWELIATKHATRHSIIPTAGQPRLSFIWRPLKIPLKITTLDKSRLCSRRLVLNVPAFIYPQLSSPSSRLPLILPHATLRSPNSKSLCLLTLNGMNLLNVDPGPRRHGQISCHFPAALICLSPPPPLSFYPLQQIFRGNVDNNTPSASSFTPPIEAQYVRIYPQVCRRHCTLRMELLGCELSGERVKHHPHVCTKHQ